MATTKSPAKKSVKKATPSRAAAKPARTTVRSVRKPESTPNTRRSFKVTQPQDPFFTFRITHQTIYWLVLAGFVLLLGLWVTDINVRVNRIYDQVDAKNAADADMLPVKKKAP